ILLTARLAVPDLDKGITALTIRPLDPHDAVRLMTSDPATAPGADPDIARICRELDYLPLALVSARNSLRSGLSAHRFLTEVRRQRPEGEERQNAFAVS